MHDPGHIILQRALRVALVLPLTYVFVTYVLKLGVGAPYAVFGTFALLAFADFGGPNRDRARAYLITGGAGLVAILLGTLAAGNAISAVASTFIVGVVLTFSSVLRGYVAAATTSVLLPFVIAVTAGPAIGQLPQRLAAFAVAVIISTAAALLLWPSHSTSTLRLRVADVMSASANAVRAIWPDAHGVKSVVSSETRLRELREATNHMEAAYSGRLVRPGGATARDRGLMQLIDDLKKLRVFIGWRADDSENLRLPADHALARLAADELDNCAQAIGAGGPAPDIASLDIGRDEHRAVTEEWATQKLSGNPSPAQVKDVEEALDAGFHLRLIAMLSELIARHTRIAAGFEADNRPLRGAGASISLPDTGITIPSILRSQLSFRSPWLRNSLRSGLALSIAVLVVQITGVPHGFWVVLGTLTALRLDAFGTGRTALQAIAGTAAGFAIGTGLLFVVGDHTEIYWILLPIVTFASAFTPGAISMIVGQASFTLFVIVFYGLVEGPQVQTGEIRLLDVGIGLCISLAVSGLMWPRGVVAQVRRTLVASGQASTAYLVAAYDRLISGAAAEGKLESARKKATENLRIADETFDLAISMGGTAPMYTQTWSMLSNAFGGLMACSDLVTYLARSGRTPVGCPTATDTMIAAAHHVQVMMDVAVDTLDSMAGMNKDKGELLFDSTGPKAPADNVNGNPFPRLEEQVSSCLASWGGAPPAPGVTLGEAALSIIWARDWLLHVHWLTHRTMEACLAEAAQQAEAQAAASS